MAEDLIYIGLDVDDKTFHGSIVTEEGELLSFCCKPKALNLIKKLKALQVDLRRVRICYESTYLGFSLARELMSKNIHCDVIASSMIPELASKRVKTDRIDSEKLALYFKQGLLTVVHQPDEQDEVVRNLVRLRKFIVEQIKGSKNRLRSQAKLFGVDLPKGQKWSHSYSDKLNIAIKSVKNEMVRNLLLIHYKYLLKQIVELEEIEQEICYWASSEKYKTRHDALVCLRGMSTLASMTVITELGDIHRFDHPKKLVSYIGLGIKEHSSGGRENKFGITKMGNKHLRRCLVEGNQTRPKSSQATTKLRARRKNADSKVVEIAEKWDERIYKKSMRLTMREKNTNKIKVACAREQIGFIWEILKVV